MARKTQRTSNAKRARKPPSVDLKLWDTPPFVECDEIYDGYLDFKERWGND